MTCYGTTDSLKKLERAKIAKTKHKAWKSLCPKYKLFIFILLLETETLSHTLFDDLPKDPGFPKKDLFSCFFICTSPILVSMFSYNASYLP